MIRYSIRPAHPEAHIFETTVSVDRPDEAGQCLALPAWIPGSYLIREFAKHVVSIGATSRGRAVRLTKEDKHTWRADPVDGPLVVTMRVYAWDLSVRGAHLDTTHGFFNGTSVFLRVVGREQERCELEILRPRGARFRRWRVATALVRAGAGAYGFGRYMAVDYDELIDSPVEMGTFTLATFRARGVPHDVAITGRHAADMDRLARDMKRICEHQIDFFGRPAPMKRYVFLVTALGEGYGGLEHRASTALLCSRNDLPRAGMREPTDAYRGFLGLVSHEYFHTWNVKRIKPAAFTPYALDRENYTRLLWVFEGFTSYYDDLALVRAGLIDRKTYLETIAKSITALLRTPGRQVQSVAESSFDAWIKYYRMDENTPNAVVSYYGKGSLVALCLDLLIRSRTRGRKSLDDVMRALWTRHGLTGAGVTEDGVERLAAEVTRLDLRAFFAQAVRGTGELPLARLLATVGVTMTVRAARSSADRGGIVSMGSVASVASVPPRISLGLRVAADGDTAKITHVLSGGAGEAAGLAAGDEIVAIDALRVGAKSFDDRLQRYRPGDRLRVHAFRRDELMQLDAEARAAPVDTCDLALPTGRVRTLEAWLGR